ncbi:hypothetical protein C5167_043488 [Papaver somniferum]|uniref:Uncharacterized protein n=1 Tax=Papaver somniferum TaxID=3469 RepID=A0A4Y7L9D5_PAPSO|nr:hypothetical protein C5167_043488 [Papaver somniferum]
MVIETVVGDMVPMSIHIEGVMMIHGNSRSRKIIRRSNDE